MRRSVRIAFFLGLAGAIALVAWVGVGDVSRAVGHVGWRALLLPAIYVLPLTLAAWSWRLVTPRSARPGWWTGVRATWIGLAINWLLPVAQVGGEVVKARLLVRRGAATDAAVASVVVDKTLQVATQIMFTVVGVALFASRWSGREVIAGAIGGTLPLLLGVVVFYRMQRRGLFGRLAHRFEIALEKAGHGALVADAAGVDAAVDAIYRKPGPTLLACGLRLLFRFSLALETALALELLGYRPGVVAVLVLESLGQAVRTGAFLAPAGIGVQEGAFVVLATALGLPPEIGLAVSLLKRGRELVVGVPGLIAWQIVEVRARRGRRA